MEFTGVRRFSASAVGVVFVVAAWAVAARVIGNEMLLPSPSRVAVRLARDLSHPLVWNAMGHTLYEAVLGCAAGSVVALVLAYVIYRSAFISAACAPVIAVSQSIPAVAIAPLLVIWVGYGVVAISFLCAIIVFFPILVSTVLGLRGLPDDVMEAARLDGASGWRMLAYMEAPLALPAVLAGLRTGFTLSVIGAVVGEFVMGGTGLGARLSLQSAAVDMPGLFSTVAMLCTMATGMFMAIAAVERHYDKRLSATPRARHAAP